MSIVAHTRQATASELAKEMDRRGEVIETLEAAIARLRDEVIEECAALIEANMLCDDYRTSTEVLLPRTNPGNKVGFAYAAALRALKSNRDTHHETR